MATNSTTTAATPLVFPAVHGTSGAAVRQERQRGYTEGHTAGYTAGMRRATEEAVRLQLLQDSEHAALLAELRAANAAKIAALTVCTEAVAATATPVLADVEQTLFDAALELAQAILGQELNDAGTSSRAALTRALAGGGDVPPLRVRMNPRDVVALQSQPDGLAAGGIDIVSDPAMAPGDAVADFPDGFLDASIASALERARQSLQESRT